MIADSLLQSPNTNRSTFFEYSNDPSYFVASKRSLGANLARVDTSLRNVIHSTFPDCLAAGENTGPRDTTADSTQFAFFGRLLVEKFFVKKFFEEQKN